VAARTIKITVTGASTHSVYTYI